MKDNQKAEKEKSRWTARRIAALAGIILLLLMYGSTMVFALMGSALSKGLLMGSIFCTIAVPILLYAMTLVAKNVRSRGANSEIRDAYDKIKNDQAESSDSPDRNQ